MTKNCGSCKHWDRDNKEFHRPANGYVADCNCPVPDWANQHDMFYMDESSGEDCKAYEERKE